MLNIRTAVLEELQMLLEEAESPIEVIDDTARLNADLGLSSLDLAELTAVLEVRLEVDPFAELVAITDVRTVGDLCAAYAKALNPETQAEVVDELEAARQRLKNRRKRSRAR